MASAEKPAELVKLTGTFLAPKQSCNVVEVGGAELEVDVVVEVGGVLLLQVPKPDWHPEPQYAAVEPLSKAKDPS